MYTYVCYGRFRLLRRWYNGVTCVDNAVNNLHYWNLGWSSCTDRTMRVNPALSIHACLHLVRTARLSDVLECTRVYAVQLDRYTQNLEI